MAPVCTVPLFMTSLKGDTQQAVHNVRRQIAPVAAALTVNIDQLNVGCMVVVVILRHCCAAVFVLHGESITDQASPRTPAQRTFQPQCVCGINTPANSLSVQHAGARFKVSVTSKRPLRPSANSPFVTGAQQLRPGLLVSQNPETSWRRQEAFGVFPLCPYTPVCNCCAFVNLSVS